MTSEPSPVFAAIRARSLLGMLVLAFVAAGIGAALIWPEWLTTEEASLADAVTLLAIYVLLACFLSAACLKAGVLKQFTLGPRPCWRDMRIYILLSIPLVGIAVFGIYVLYLPLSYVYPGFVNFMLLEYPPLFLWHLDLESLLANGINAIIIVVIAPVIEEVFFRGFLLNSWWRKYGLRKAAFLSSLVFAALHVDIIGGIVFGIVLSLVYVRTKSLIGPIVAHACNNGIAVLVTVYEEILYGDFSSETLEDFRAYWWLAVLGGAVGIPWLLWFRKWLSRQQFDTA